RQSGHPLVKPLSPPEPSQIAAECSEQSRTVTPTASRFSNLASAEFARCLCALDAPGVMPGGAVDPSSESARGIGSRSTADIRPLNSLIVICGPQDSNLQPRDSRAPVFPRGLDYLILPARDAQHPSRAQRSDVGRAAGGEAGRSRRG